MRDGLPWWNENSPFARSVTVSLNFLQFSSEVTKLSSDDNIAIAFFSILVSLEKQQKNKRNQKVQKSL